MEPKCDEEYIFNLKLARLVGINRILDPNTTKLFGYNAMHIIIVFFVLFVSTSSMLCPIGLYYLTNDVTAFIFYLGCVINLLLSCYKIINVLYYSEDLWKCIEITSIKFISYKGNNMSIMKNWRLRSIRVSYICFTIVFAAWFCWSLSPCAFKKTTIKIKNLDGSYNYYRMNIFNIYLLVSDETYNNHFNIFYFIEIINGVCFFYFTIIYDILMITMCFAISCQLEAIYKSFKFLGYNCSKRKYLSTYRFIHNLT